MSQTALPAFENGCTGSMKQIGLLREDHGSVLLRLPAPKVLLHSVRGAYERVAWYLEAGQADAQDLRVIETARIISALWSVLSAAGSSFWAFNDLKIIGSSEPSGSLLPMVGHVYPSDFQGGH